MASASAPCMCVQPLWDLYGCTLRHNQTSPCLYQNKSQNHKPTGLSRGGIPKLILLSRIYLGQAPKPGNLYLIYIARGDAYSNLRRRHGPHLHRPSASCKPYLPCGEQHQDQEGHGVSSLETGWWCHSMYVLGMC